MIDDLNYDDLDPGIRETVHKMRLANGIIAVFGLLDEMLEATHDAR